MNAMPSYDVAHINEQGVDLIIIPLDSSFGWKTKQQQSDIKADLQLHANAARLAGTVVPVWDAGGGRMGFLAPTQWHQFFSSINLQFVAANINKSLCW
jgi:hypothetical protein